MTVRPDPYVVDDENPELTDEQIRAMRTPEALPPALHEKPVANYEARHAARRCAAGRGWKDRTAAMLRRLGFGKLPSSFDCNSTRRPVQEQKIFALC